MNFQIKKNKIIFSSPKFLFFQGIQNSLPSFYCGLFTKRRGHYCRSLRLCSSFSVLIIKNFLWAVFLTLTCTKIFICLHNLSQRFLSYLLNFTFSLFSQLDGYFFLTSLNVQINLRVSTTVRKSHAENHSALLTQKVVKQIAAYEEK